MFLQAVTVSDSFHQCQRKESVRTLAGLCLTRLLVTDVLFNGGACVWDEFFGHLLTRPVCWPVFCSSALYVRSSQRWKIWKSVVLSIVCAVRAVALSLTSHTLTRTPAKRRVIIQILRLPLPSIPRSSGRHPKIPIVRVVVRLMLCPIARVIVRLILRPMCSISYREYRTKQEYKTVARVLCTWFMACR